MALKTWEIVAIIVSVIVILSILAFSLLSNDDKKKKEENQNNSQFWSQNNQNIKSNNPPLQQHYVNQDVSLSKKSEKNNDKKSESVIEYNAPHRNIPTSANQFIPIKTEKISLELSQKQKGNKSNIRSKGQGFTPAKGKGKSKSIMFINLQSADAPTLTTCSLNEQGAIVKTHNQISFAEYKNQLQSLCNNISNINDINNPQLLATQPQFLGCKALLSDPYFDTEKFKDFFLNEFAGDKNINNLEKVPILLTGTDSIVTTLFLDDGNQIVSKTFPCINKDISIKKDDTLCATTAGTYDDKAKKLLLTLSGKIEYSKNNSGLGGQKQYFISKIELGSPAIIKEQGSSSGTSFTKATLNPNSIILEEHGNKQINNSNILSCLNAGHTLAELGF